MKIRTAIISIAAAVAIAAAAGSLVAASTSDSVAPHRLTSAQVAQRADLAIRLARALYPLTTTGGETVVGLAAAAAIAPTSTRAPSCVGERAVAAAVSAWTDIANLAATAATRPRHTTAFSQTVAWDARFHSPNCERR